MKNKFLYLTGIFLIIICNLNIWSTPNKEKLESQLNQLLQQDTIKRKELIESLDSETASSLISYIRYKYIQNQKEMEVIFSLYDQLANLKAIELSYKRLNKLLWVILLTLLIFSIYVSIILIQQNQIIKKLNQIQNNKEKNAESQKERVIYRGET